ncbi:MAG: hypothetical protein ACRD4I_16880, partial [Candidatus Angelobacter sp.]
IVSEGGTAFLNLLLTRRFCRTAYSRFTLSPPNHDIVNPGSRRGVEAQNAAIRAFRRANTLSGCDLAAYEAI